MPCVFAWMSSPNVNSGDRDLPWLHAAVDQCLCLSSVDYCDIRQLWVCLVSNWIRLLTELKILNMAHNYFRRLRVTL